MMQSNSGTCNFADLLIMPASLELPMDSKLTRLASVGYLYTCAEHALYTKTTDTMFDNIDSFILLFQEWITVTFIYYFTTSEIHHRMSPFGRQSQVTSSHFFHF